MVLNRLFVDGMCGYSCPSTDEQRFDHETHDHHAMFLFPYRHIAWRATARGRGSYRLVCWCWRAGMINVCSCPACSPTLETKR